MALTVVVVGYGTALAGSSRFAPELLTALLGTGGVASVISAVFAARAHGNSKQLQRDHGSSVADAVARTEQALTRTESELGKLAPQLSRIEAVQSAQGHELAAVNARLKHLEASTATTREEILEERKARRRDFATLEDEIEHSFTKKTND